MTFLTYTQGIPDGPNNPSTDQPDMKTNNDSNFTIWQGNHYGFEDPNGGKHLYIQLPLNDAPAGSTGAKELLLCNAFDALTSKYNLHFLPPSTLIAGNLIQLTRNEKPVNSGTGFTWMAGNILIQWGIKNNPGAGGGISFSPNFSAPAYTVLTTLYTADNVIHPLTVNVVKGSVTAAGFSYICTDSNPNSDFYWLAIGT